MTQKEIGAYLKKVREEKGITLYKVHAIDKIATQQTLKTLEAGKGGQIETLLRYCEYLKVDLVPILRE